MREFLAMGSYGFYVWGSYALALAVLAGQAVVAWVRVRRLERTLGNTVDRDET